MVRSAAPRALFLAALAIAAAACADHPVGPRMPPPEIAPPPVQAALQCRMDVRAETLACGPAAPEVAAGVSPLIIGGQGTNVRLRSSGTSYDAGTGILRSEVTVENLMQKALGTDDGVFPSPQGLRVFFHSGPTVTEGTGVVSVDNPDGEGLFTAGAQPYFQYAGLLAPGDTSAAREWRFSVPNSVEFFVFTVFVSAPVPGETTPSAGIFLLAGAGLADTVDAEPDSVLRIGVRGANGKPAAYQYIEVSAASVPGQYYYEPEMLVGRVGDGVPGSSTYGVTDSMGIAEFRVKMGRKAGAGRLIVSSPYQSLTDTARFTILPGATREIRSFPEDTVVMMGGRAPLRAVGLDRHGNARSEAATLSVAAGPGTVDGSDVVAGSTIGRVRAVVMASGFRDTSYVTVVPNGMVAAYTNPTNSGETSTLYTFSLDGSDVREVRETIVGVGYNGDMAVGWLSPTKLVYHDNNWDHTKQLYTVDLETGKVARFLPLRDWMAMENYPKVSRDGSWVYFSGGTYSGWSIYRARADGTGKEPVAFSPAAMDNEWGADLSPDGARVVFVRAGYYSAGQLTIGELGTGAARSLDLQGHFPRWSPDGSRIAFVATDETYYYARGPLAVVNADGTDARALTIRQFEGAVEWSPDGKYVIGSIGGNQLAIIDVETEAEVVVSYPGIEGTLLSPAWKP